MPRPTDNRNNQQTTTHAPMTTQGAQNTAAQGAPVQNAPAQNAFAQSAGGNTSAHAPMTFQVPQQRSAYQQNMDNQASNAAQNASRWYSGDQPTYLETLGQVGKIYKQDRNAGTEAFNMFNAERMDSASQLYTPYAQTTNRAVDYLKQRGFDVDGITEETYRQYSPYLVYNGSTNAPSKPGKKASQEQWDAYYLYQYGKAVKDTNGVNSEWAAMQEELAYWADSGLNLSDDEIVDRVFSDENMSRKYPTLKRLDDSTKEGGYLLELNNGTDYSRDNAYGVIWAARNNGGVGDATANTMLYAMGEGNQYKYNEEISSKRNWNDPGSYSRYQLGMTLEDEGLYFGKHSFTNEDVDQLRRTIDPNNPDELRYFQNVEAANQKTIELESELDALNKQIDKLVEIYADDENGFTRIMDRIDQATDANGNLLYGGLFNLDKTLDNGSELVKTTRAIDYRRKDLEQKVKEKLEQAASKKDTAGFVDGLVGEEPAKGTDAGQAPAAAPEETPAEIPATEPKTGRASVFTDVELAAEKAAKDAYNKAVETVEAVGTEAEKVALQTGKTTLFDRAVELINESIRDEKEANKKLGQVATQQAVDGYYDKHKTVLSYEENEKKLTDSQAALDELTPRLDELSSRFGYTDIMDQLETLRVLDNMNYGEDNDWDWARGRLVEDPDNINALGVLYARVTGTEIDRLAFSEDVQAQEQARKWAAYFTGEYKSENPLTPEEEEELQFLNEKKDALQDEIDRCKEYAEQNEAAYKTAKRDTAFLSSVYAAAATANGEMDPNLIAKMDLLCNASTTFYKHQWTPYSPYEMQVNAGTKTYEDAQAEAKESSIDSATAAQIIGETLEMADRYGMVLGDEERKNALHNKEELEWNALDAGYFALDSSENFEEHAKAGREKADQSNNRIVKAVLGKNAGLEGKDWLSAVSIATAATATKEVTDTHAFADAMTEEEKKRFFSLYDTDGEEAAIKYFEHLTDEDRGVVRVRTNEELAKKVEEFTEQNALTMLVGSALSVFTRKGAAAVSLVNRIIGKDNPMASESQIITDAARKGATDWINDTIGIGSIPGTIYQIGMGLIDFKTDAAMLGPIFKGATTALEGSSLAGKFGAKIITKGIDLASTAAAVTPSALISTEKAYNDALTATGGDVEKARELAGWHFAADMISSTLVMNGIHGIIKADPKGFSASFGDFLKKAVTNGMAAGTGTLVEEVIDENAERIILDEDSKWGQLKQKYIEAGYPESMAESAADEEIKKNITSRVFDSVWTSLLRTGVTYGVKAAEQKLQPEFDKIDVAVRYIKDKLGLGDKNTEAEPMTYGQLVDRPEGVAPEDAIVNPNHVSGVDMYDRSTGKAHHVVAFTMEDNGNIIFYDDQGEAIPFLQFAMQNGQPATNFTEQEMDMLSYAWQYGKENYTPVDAGYTGFTYGTEGETPEQSTEIPPNYDVKDLAIVGSMYGSTPTSAATGAASVLYLGDGNEAKAAGQALVGSAAGGDTNTAAAALYGLAVNSPFPEQMKGDVVTASLVDGQGAEALAGIIEKVQNGEEVTAEDVNMLHAGAEADRSDPEYEKKLDDAVTENRVANRTIEIASVGEMAKRIETAQKTAKEAMSALVRATSFAEQKHNELEAAGNSLVTADEQYDPSKDPQTEGPVQKGIHDILGADVAARQADESVEVHKEKSDEAQKTLSDTRTEVMNDARQEATVQIGQEKANEQAEREAQALAAAQAEQQHQALMQQEAEAEKTELSNWEAEAREYLSGKGMEGERLEKHVQRWVEMKTMQKRGQVDTEKQLDNQDDPQSFLRSISRQTGMTFEMQDLGDPTKVRAKIEGKNRVILNSRISSGWALIEAANHEIPHGLEDTGAYKPFADTVLKILYGGAGTDAYNKAIVQKMKDYRSMGITLSPEDAEHELVSEYGRLNMVNKKFIRKVISRGIGSQMKYALSEAQKLLKGYRFKGQAKRAADNIKKAERLYFEAVDERARMVKEGYKGHTGMTQFSVTGVADSVGLSVETTGDDKYMYRLYDNSGNEIAPGQFTPDMVKGTPVGRVIDLAEKYSTAENKAEIAETQRKFMADIVNMIGQYQDAAMVWELAGNLAFSNLKTNGDTQYSDSYDMGTICTKTQAILNAISESQLMLGRTLTKKEIDSVVYEEVGRGVYDKETGKWKHGATPCPPCYVYATWVNKPARLGLVQKYQKQCKDWTDEQINKFMSNPDAVKSQKLWISTCLADEHEDPETGEITWTRKENPSICPDDVLLDLRRSGDMAEKYPGTWTFMQKGGNAQGKAIAPYSDSRLGESIVGKAIGAGELNKRLLEDARNAGNPDYVPQFLNPFLVGMDAPNAKEAAKLADQYFKKALKKAAIQNLKGGQRWQSWSDFRAEWGSDYLMEMLTMQALGAKVQTYTKVPQAMDLFASAGFEVNMSLMPKGDGFEHNKDGSFKLDENGNKILAFSGVTGMDPKAAEAYARKYGEQGNVQPMVVGISDEHIKAALAGDYITFVIPFHGSGGSVKRLQHLMKLLSEQMKTGNDYTKAQSDKFERYTEVTDGDSTTKVNANPNWYIREAILTGAFKDGISVEDQAAMDANPYLKKLYEDRYLNEASEAYGVFFTKKDAQQIFPYEYWDKDTTLATADRNSTRFIEYCQSLGVIPRFSGLKKKGGAEYGNFSGRTVDKETGEVTYNPIPGYWKLLIDRPMYNRIYGEDGKLIPEKCTYHDPKAVNVGNIDVGAAPMDANNTTGHSDAETREIAGRIFGRLATSGYQDMTLGNTASEQQENATVVKKAMYADSDVQLSGPGDMSDAELEEAIRQSGKRESDEKYLAAVDSGDTETAQRMVDERAQETGYTIRAYHGSNSDVQFTKFRPGARGEMWFSSSEGTAYNQRNQMYDTYLRMGNPYEEIDYIGARSEFDPVAVTENGRNGGHDGSIVHFRIDPQLGSKLVKTLESAGMTDILATDSFSKSFLFLPGPEQMKVLAKEGETLADFVNRGMSEDLYQWYTVYNPEQIKSADPVTYQDDGVTPVPLSERFNTEEPDIRYSNGGDMSDAELMSAMKDIDEEIEKTIDSMSADELREFLDVDDQEETQGVNLSKGKPVKEAVTAVVEDLKSEFDPTIYNGRLYVKPETMDYWLSDSGFASGNPNYAQAYITTMNPKDFLRMTTASEAGQNKLLGEATTLNEEKLAENAKRQPIQLYFNAKTGRITGHEGRHRSIALARAGVTEIPVLLFDRDEKTKYTKEPMESLTLEGQNLRQGAGSIVNGNTITFNDVIPLSSGNSEELYRRFVASDEERAMAEQNQQRILDYSMDGDLSDAELLSLMAESGSIPQELAPAPHTLSAGTVFGGRQRQFGHKTAQESDALHEQVKQYLFNNSSYSPDTNNEQISRALGWIQSKGTENDPDGYYAALKEVMDPDFNFSTADGQARMQAVMGMAVLKAEQGDERALQDEIDLADAFNKQGTGLGQALQARKLFRLMTPIGRKAVLQREADRINQNLADRGKDYRVSIPDALLEQAANARTEEEFNNARKQIRDSLNAQLPVTWAERIIGWRMLSMLSAPKTHIRNTGGNLINVPVVGVKNKIGAVLEYGAQKLGKLDKSERTKTIGLSNPAARKFASARTGKIEDVLRGNAKYGEGDQRQQERKIFGTKDNAVSKTFGKALQWWYDANGKALEWEDWLFLKYHYTRALGGYMTARGLKPEDMKGTVLEDADLYAIKEAHKATYRDDSGVANWMNRIGSKKTNADNNKALSVIQWFVNTRFPFKRTPINIAKRGIEYSPVGLGKSLTYDMMHLKQYLDAKNGKLEKMPKSAISPTEWIDKFSAGLTGTGIMIAGVVAAALGIARAGLDNNDPDDQIAKMAGEQEYSIRPGKLTNLELIDEDVSMTLDWAAPSVLPFFTGVGLKEYLEKNGFSIGGVLDLMMEVTEPMMNMSFMSGVSDMFKNNGYSTKDGFWQFIEKTGINFVNSLVPTWAGQIASTVDGRRTTYSGGESLTGDPEIDKMVQQIGNKIPWLNLGGIPYTNTLGEEPEHVIAPWAENLLSPAYFSKVDDSDEMKELGRLYLETDNKAILPAAPKKTIRINGEDVKLNGEQYTKLKADHGTVWRETVQAIINNPLYANASDDSRAAMFNMADTYASNIAKYMTDDRYKLDSWMESAYLNGNAADVIIDKIAEKNKRYYVEGQTKSFAEALMSNSPEDIRKFADELNEAHASPSDVRKHLTAYFKPLYKEAFQNGDDATMYMIEDILNGVNDYLVLEKPVTKYKKKDFDKWLTSSSTVSEDDEDEEENDWLNTGSSGSLSEPIGMIASAGGRLPARSKPNGIDREEAEDELYRYTEGQLYGYGNIDLNNRQVVYNPDGSISTEYSITIDDDGQRVIIPTVIDGKIVSEEEAIDHYEKTGEHLGKFEDPDDADWYAEMLHNRQDWYYNR